MNVGTYAMSKSDGPRSGLQYFLHTFFMKPTCQYKKKVMAGLHEIALYIQHPYLLLHLPVSFPQC